MSMPIVLFNPTASHAARAVQAWQILVGRARDRQTLTYESLSEVMFQKPAAGVLAAILGHIAFFCGDEGLPPLNCIVVGKHVGTPGHGIPTNPADVDAERERVYAYDWFNLYPPTESALKAAYDAHT